MSDEQQAQEIGMLRAEIEMLMSERQALLRATGAAAVFVANLDSESLPEDTYAVADILAQNRKSNNNGVRSRSSGRASSWTIPHRPQPTSA